MSPTTFKLAIAATGVIAILWSAPSVLTALGCNSCAAPPDVPRVAPGVIPSRRIG